MNAPFFPPADVAGQVDVVCVTAAGNAAADLLLSALAEVPAHTDLSTSRQHALGLAAKVRFYADNDQPGMLGTNGIAPAVFACVRDAKAAGFDWRKHHG